jgi:hypothetical protein
MKAMATYQESIICATGCTPADAVEVEDYMRHIYFHSTLDWQSKALFDKGARESYREILWMRSPEGIRYMKGLEERQDFSGVIDDTFEEVDLSGFINENPGLIPGLKKKYKLL